MRGPLPRARLSGRLLPPPPGARVISIARIAARASIALGCRTKFVEKACTQLQTRQERAPKRAAGGYRRVGQLAQIVRRTCKSGVRAVHRRRHRDQRRGPERTSALTACLPAPSPRPDRCYDVHGAAPEAVGGKVGVRVEEGIQVRREHFPVVRARGAATKRNEAPPPPSPPRPRRGEVGFRWSGPAECGGRMSRSGVRACMQPYQLDSSSGSTMCCTASQWPRRCWTRMSSRWRSVSTL